MIRSAPVASGNCLQRGIRCRLEVRNPTQTAMDNRIQVTPKGDYVEVISDGEKDYDFACRLWKQVSEVCNEQDCFSVLGIANTTRLLSPWDAFDHHKIFQAAGIDKRYRIAWVETNPQATEILRFIETVLMHQGLQTGIFSSVDEARQWLRHAPAAE